MSEYTPHIIRTASGQEFDDTAARYFWDEINALENPLVVLPTGNTPLGVYKSLITCYSDKSDIWSRFRYLQLDEYTGLPQDDQKLFARWLDREILGPAGVPADNRITFNSAAADPAEECARIETFIRENGPIDLVVLGLGVNGHIGFNEPGSPFDSRTRLVTLSPETRKANAAYWDIAAEDIPETAFTLGLETLSTARRVLLLVSGAHKADILDRTLNGPVTPEIPASFLRMMPDVTIIADQKSLKK